MSFQAEAVAITNMLAVWMGTESTGTSLADATGNSHAATLNTAKGTLGGAAIIPECARAITAGGGTGGVVANLSVAGGSPFQTQEVTYGIFFKMGTPVATGYLGGRNNNWQIRQVGTSGVLEAVVWLGGTPYVAVGRTVFPAGTVALATLHFDGTDIILIVNKAYEARATTPGGTITATTDDMEIGSGSSTDAFSGVICPAFVATRALSHGEHCMLLDAADTGMTIRQGPVPSFYDLASDKSAAVAATPQSKWCAPCGGQMRTRERSTDEALWPIHPGACTELIASPARLLTSGSALVDFSAQAKWLVHEFINAVSIRTNPSDTRYWDGTQFQPSTDGLFIQAAGIGTAAAIMHRYRPAKGSPWLQIVHGVVEGLILNMNPSGPWRGSFSTNAAGQQIQYADGSHQDADEFCQMELGMMVLLSKNSVDPTTWERWRDAFLESATYLVNGPGAGATPDFYYYVNGNRQLICLGIAKLAYLITGNSNWNTIFEAELLFAANPPATAGAASLSGNASGAGLIDATTGLQIPVANLSNGTYSIGTSGKAYFTESSGTDAEGCDWVYLQLQLSFLVRIYLLSGDARIALLISMLWNQMATRVNWTTLQYDCTGGTRHSEIDAVTTMAPYVLNFKLGRSDITVANLAFNWTSGSGGVNGIEQNYRSQGMGQGNVSYYRGVGLEPAALIMAAADWEGIPTASGAPSNITAPVITDQG